jgi:hypothetical protein
MKTAIVVFADPSTGTEEALGRLFNSLFLTYELKQKGREVALLFQGAGTRWASEVVRPEHPAHALYALVEDQVAGVCGGCADVFGARDAATAAGARLVREAMIPGTTGVTDLSRYLDEGYALVTF